MELGQKANLPTHDMGFLYGNDYVVARDTVHQTAELGQNLFTLLDLRSTNQKLALVWAVTQFVCFP